MNETTIMDVIPPEQWTMIIAGIIGLLGTILAALGFLFRWFVRYFARSQDEKLNAMRQEREIEKAEFEAKIRQRDLEVQNRLDETQSGRETMRLLFSELSESRKEDKEIRASYERREMAHIQAMQGIESNTAATLHLMKEMVERLGNHQEADEVMAIRQEKIIAQGDKTHNQNEATHSKLEAVTNTLAEILAELKNVNVNRASDRQKIDDIYQKLSHVQENLAQMESKTVATATPSDIPAVTPVTEISEASKGSD